MGGHPLVEDDFHFGVQLGEPDGFRLSGRLGLCLLPEPVAWAEQETQPGKRRAEGMVFVEGPDRAEQDQSEQKELNTLDHKVSLNCLKGQKRLENPKPFPRIFFNEFL